MRISFSACKQVQPLMNFPGSLINMDQLIIPRPRRKDKVVVVMGATGTGKSRLSIDLATRFDAEIINSDKMQVYKGLDIVTNKVTDEECSGVPHHLLGIVDPDEDFTTDDFVYHASVTADAITRRGRLPIIAGGSNSYIKALVNDDIEFRSKVDQMMEAGLMEEVREFFETGDDYTHGVRRAIGVPEMDEYFRNESMVDGETKAKLLEVAIDQIKSNTCILACRQLQNISRLEGHLERRMHLLDATEAFLRRDGDADEVWEKVVASPSTMIVGRFLCEDDIDFMSAIAVPPPLVTTTTTSVILGSPNATPVATATH